MSDLPTIKPERKRKRSRRSKAEPNLQAKITGIALLALSILYLYFLWRTQSFLDTLEARGGFRIPKLLFAHHEKPIGPPPDRYIVFSASIKGGQGTGNIISGLLAAHLFGEEFNRIVCVEKSYIEFHTAFEPVHPWAAEKCPDLPDRRQKDIQIINYQPPPPECWLKEYLASDKRIIYYVGNTYPRWPVIPDNFFFTHYRARPELLKILPFDKPPETVVHLRAPDSHYDERKGLDTDALKALGRELPHDTYLVTNRIAWYDEFEKEFGWRHPNWDEVAHSAFRWQSWGQKEDKDVFYATRRNTTMDRETQNLQMWADWYTILSAKRVYHTHSDFSISAIHWQNIESKTLMGYNNETKKLELVDESWRVDGETPRLVDRTVDGKGKSRLRYCDRKHLPAAR